MFINGRNKKIKDRNKKREGTCASGMRRRDTEGGGAALSAVSHTAPPPLTSTCVSVYEREVM